MPSLKVDRATANPQWLNLYKDARLENLPIAGSDYGHFLLFTDSWSRSGKYPLFKFEATWLLQDSFMQLVKQTWQKFVTGTSAQQLARKSKLLKKNVKVWKKSLHDNEYHDIDRI